MASLPARSTALSGWLLKRVPALGDHWSQLWCVLYEDEEEDSWVLDCYADESASKKLLHIVLGFAARVLPTNSKHVPPALSKLYQQHPFSFVLDSGEGRLCPLYVFDALSQERLSSWQQVISSCARELTRRQKTQEEQDRVELIGRIFALLENGAGTIWTDEFRRYAETLGFSGSDDDWSREFQEICEDRGWKEEKGISLTNFTKFLSKDPDMSVEELLEISEALDGQRDSPVSDSWARQSVASNLVKLRTRADIVDALFISLKCKDTGRIGSQELHRYAKLSGFDGDDDDWAEEFEELCAEQGWDKEEGLGHHEFLVLMENESMGSDQELKAMLLELRMPPKRTFAQMSQWAGKTASTRVRSEVAEMPRDDLVNEAFASLDVRRQDLLGSREFRRYAELTGYDGGDEFWDEQYEELCRDYNWDPDAGVTKEEFIAFLGDEANSPDEELRELVLELRLRQDVAARRFRSAVRRVAWMLRYAGLAIAKGDYTREEIQRMSRKQLADAVFHSLDRRQRQKLDSKAMRIFANATGFLGDEEDWAKEFAGICEELGWNEERGVSKSQFLDFIGDEESTSSEELRILLFNLPAPELPRAILAAKPIKTTESMSREELVDELYMEVQRPDARRAAGEVLVLSLSEELSRDDFEKLIAGEEEHSTRSLRKALMDLRKQRSRDSVFSQSFARSHWHRPSSSKPHGRASLPPELRPERLSSMTRDELIEGLFHALDADHGATGALEAASVRIFAEATGFEGTDEQWQEQLEAMYSFFGWETGEAISNTQFAELVNNDEDTTDDELREVLFELLRRQALHRPSSRTSRSSRASTLPWQRNKSIMPNQEEVERMNRRELIDSIFTILGDRSEYLYSWQVRTFAERTGFDGDDLEWEERFTHMLEDFGWSAEGISKEDFAQFLGDEDEYNDDELRRVLLSLQLQRRMQSSRSSQRSHMSHSWSRKSFNQSMSMSRDSLVMSIFRCLAGEGSLRVPLEGIRSFAEETGFEGSEVEWEEQLEAMQQFFRWAPGQGLSAEEFAQLVDHDEDTTEEELREVLARLQRRDLRKSEQRRSQRRSERRFSVRSWGRKSFVKSEEELRRLSRVELISRIFTTLNRQEGIQQSQSLSQEGFRRFAELTGFEGSDLEWEQQFTGICKLYGWNPQKEISLHHFQEFLSDEEETHEDELREVLSTLQHPRESSSSQNWNRRSFALKLQEDETMELDRMELIDSIFNLLDVKKENVLRSAELLEFALFSGFDGTEDEWNEQYTVMCSRFGWDDALGVSKEQFQELVGDESETSDDELRRILLQQGRS
ncbi:unnamed protein product [Durusdinium trenchii]|uniref:PH domain-containing protein n=3 Tax=Durusdinium trenchii TaxID=1381693 RepID=A0ABP0IKM9_9DINO